MCTIFPLASSVSASHQHRDETVLAVSRTHPPGNREEVVGYVGRIESHRPPAAQTPRLAFLMIFIVDLIPAAHCTSKSVADCDTVTIVSDVGDFGGPTDVPDSANPNTVKVKLPPLVVKNVPLNKLISDFASPGVAAEYKLCGIGMMVMLHTKVDFEKDTQFLKNSKTEFFIHDIPGEKPFKVVIRGLPGFDPKLIGAEIKDRYKLAPIAVYPIKRTVTLSALRAIRSLFSIIICWEPYRGGRRDVTQCQRCLNFGHGTRNCNIKLRCNICAKDHSTSDCPVVDAGAVQFKCANCGGDH
ncbi:uncharacterized protein LOC129717294 [Wyeomyia smithii]|uniref:uncharacterized protein LOC129717294 n=1 Tax=Wyeomyia smithii TaxID=174621 RepID=UPI002467CE63|nr:uncharacterized protein LOC129717294 [Wyeomyia smithii]